MLSVQRLLGACLIVTLSGCTTMQITSVHEPSANFSGLKTYDWLPFPQGKVDDPRIDDKFLERRIHKAVDSQLAAKGYTKPSSGQADFLVGYHVALKDKLDTVTVNRYYNYRYGTRVVRGTVPETYTREYEQGSLILDFFHGETRQLIWRGSAQAEVNLSDSMEKRDKRLNEAVQGMLEQFPPQ